MPNTPLLIWQQLLEDSSNSLVNAARQFSDFTDVKTIQSLRRLGDAEHVKAAVELVLGQRRLKAKVDTPEQFITDSEAAEQATPMNIGRHKATRFKSAGCKTVLDLCCGIGLDAATIGEHASMTLLDRDEVRTWMAGQNVHAVTGNRPETITSDVCDFQVSNKTFDAAHIDPSRRIEGRRIWTIDQMEPGIEYLFSLVDQISVGAKLSPAVDFDQLPPGHVELISSGKKLNQAVLWTGDLAFAETGQRTVTRLTSDQAIETWTAEPDLMIPCLRGDSINHTWLSTVDPLVARAGLTGALCQDLNLEAIHPALGILASDEPPNQPWLYPYRHLLTMPWRLPAVKKWCQQNNAGEVTVKTRQQAVNPDIISKQLKGTGDRSITLFVLDHGRKRLAHLTETPSH